MEINMKDLISIVCIIGVLWVLWPEKAERSVYKGIFKELFRKP